MNNLYSISQNGYPKEIILKSDTVIAITYPQLKEINSELEASKGKDIIIDSLSSLVSNYSSLTITGELLIENLKIQNFEKDKQIEYQNKITRELNKQIKKEKTKKTWGIIGGISGGIIIGFIVGFLSSN